MAKSIALKKPSLVSAKTQSEVAKATPKVKFGKYDPKAVLKATGKRVTSDSNNERVKAVSGKTISEAIATGLYTMDDLKYDIERVKTLEIV
tara:strand:- start:1808 stop:2080 length:273 start_codon:yes stop_codon:yes gene_type:complete